MGWPGNSVDLGIRSPVSWFDSAARLRAGGSHLFLSDVENEGLDNRIPKALPRSFTVFLAWIQLPIL